MLDAAQERLQRSLVVAEARRWIGTPYRHGQAIRPYGVDCAMLLVRAFVDAVIVPDFDPRPYPSSWMLHRNEERYLAWLMPYAAEVPGPPERDPLPGDVILCRVGRTMSHGGIISDWPRVIHAYIREGAVVESDFSQQGELSDIKRHPRMFFDHWAERAAP